jgi:ADP-ribose pyrophosphatase YjhB (NUDIX family)
MKGPRLIVRALLVEDGHLLVNRGRRRPRLSLFGGRVEKGETARHALERELVEELGVSVEVGRLAYQIENFYVDDRQRRIHELGLYYEVQPPRPLGATVVPRGKQFVPTWLRLDAVAESELRPRILRGRLAADLAAPTPSLVELIEVDRAAFPKVL